MIGDERISRSFRKAVDRALEQNLVYVAAISVWEFGMLVERKRISIEMDPLDWVEEVFSSGKINLVPISPRIAIQSSRLPEHPHGDPADRLLIATANDMHAVLATHDQKILDYGKGNFISVIDPL